MNYQTEYPQRDINLSKNPELFTTSDNCFAVKCGNEFIRGIKGFKLSLDMKKKSLLLDIIKPQIDIEINDFYIYSEVKDDEILYHVENKVTGEFQKVSEIEYDYDTKFLKITFLDWKRI